MAQAATLYHQAIVLSPDLGRAYLLLGSLRERMNDPNEAERVYSRAIRIPAVAPAALDRRARLRRALGRRDAALSDLERAVALEPDRQERLEQLAGWYVEASAWPAALRVWRRLLAVRMNDPSSEATDGIREAKVRVRALVALAGTADPVTAPSAIETNWVRASLARVALR